MKKLYHYLFKLLKLSCLFAIGLLNGCSSLLFHPDRVLHYDPRSAGYQPQDIHFQSLDNTQLHGWYFSHKKNCAALAPMDPKQNCRPKAVILFFHGNGENLSSHYLSLLWILRHGYDFFIFDYRGYGRSAGEASSVKGAVEDGQAALRWIRAANKSNLPIIVFAQSLGGNIGARAIYEERNNGYPQAIVLDSTFASYKKAGSYVLSRTVITWPFQWLSYIALSDKMSAKEILGELALPVLVIHGDKDKVVDYSLGEDLFQRLNEPKEFWQIPGGVHTDVFFNSNGRYQKSFLDWLDKIMKANKE